MKPVMKCSLSTGVMLSLFTACSTTQLTGNGSEITNGISGTVIRSSGLPNDGQSVVAAIYSTDYRPDSATGTAETTLVARDGTFHFDPPENSYNLFIWDTSSGTGAYLPTLPADTAVGNVPLSEAGITAFADLSSTGFTASSYELSIPGSPYFCRVQGDEPVSIPLLPKGEYLIQIRVFSQDIVGDEPIFDDIRKIIIIDPAATDTVVLEIP